MKPRNAKTSTKQLMHAIGLGYLKRSAKEMWIWTGEEGEWMEATNAMASTKTERYVVVGANTPNQATYAELPTAHLPLHDAISTNA